MRPKITTTEASAAMHTQFDREQAKLETSLPTTTTAFSVFPRGALHTQKTGFCFWGA